MSGTSLVHLNEGAYFEKTMGFIFGSTDILLKPYETICLLMLQNKDFEIAGSDNIFPGNEVMNFEVDRNNIILKFHEHCMGIINVYIIVPETFSDFKVNGEIYKTEKINNVNLLKVMNRK
jgi:hypothetical protein